MDVLTRRRWRFAPYRETDPEHIRAVVPALEAIARHLPAEVGLDQLRICVGDDLVYLPHDYVGSCGALYVPSQQRLILLGSQAGLENYIWAYYRGFDLGSDNDDELTNQLTIHAIRDRSQTLRVLKSVFRAPYVNNELAPQLDRLPLIVDDVDLYFAIPELRSAEDHGWFEFTVRSRHAPPPGTQPRQPH